MSDLQPEHERYWRGWRLVIARWATWPQVKQMTLDEVDQQELLLYALERRRKPATDDGLVVLP